jgi:hypothetical protein
MNEKGKNLSTIVTRLGRDVANEAAMDPTSFHPSKETTYPDGEESLKSATGSRWRRYDRVLEKRLKDFIRDRNKCKNN